MAAFAERSSMRIALWLHVTGVVVWVGGMFFAHMALRPAAAVACRRRCACRSCVARSRVLPLGRRSRSSLVLASGAWMAVARGGFRAVGAASTR
jgi:uncharacterized membrane protein